MPFLTGEGLWRVYQKEAEEIVAPGGVLIANPRERNRAINAAYARLWLHDNRFQWAGLAAFASKQVGCGLVHAAGSIEKIQAEHEARQRMLKDATVSWEIPGVYTVKKLDKQQFIENENARSNNRVTGIDLRGKGAQTSYMEKQFRHVYEMMAMGNTTLFLDIFPLHAFYAKRGIKKLAKCLELRWSIVGHKKFPVLWPIGQKKLKFGIDYKEILQAFKAIDAGRIAESVQHLADHEQRNILQPAMYRDSQLVSLLRLNHLAYVSYLFRSFSQPVELTLASQCQLVDDERTITFGINPIADLSDINDRMAFVIRAATQFDQMLHSDKRLLIEQAIRNIAAGKGVR